MKHPIYCDCYECTSGDAYIKKLRNNYAGTKNVNFADEITTTQKVDIKGILGDALGGIVGDLIQAKKDGQQLPKALETVADLGIKTEQAAIDAATKKAQTSIGKNVLQFSPTIIGVIIAVVGVIVFLTFKK